MDEKPTAIARQFRRGVLVWLHLVRVHNRIAREEAALLSEYGLTAAQFDVLSHLASEPALSQQAMAERLLVTKGNVCGLVDRLENAGLVERCGDPEDRRVYQLHLTEAGRRAFEAAAPALEVSIDRQFAALSAEEQALLASLVAKLDRALRAYNTRK